MHLHLVYLKSQTIILCLRYPLFFFPFQHSWFSISGHGKLIWKFLLNSSMSTIQIDNYWQTAHTHWALTGNHNTFAKWIYKFHMLFNVFFFSLFLVFCIKIWNTIYQRHISAYKMWNETQRIPTPNHMVNQKRVHWTSYVHRRSVFNWNN